jgi:hypothetical protein
MKPFPYIFQKWKDLIDQYYSQKRKQMHLIYCFNQAMVDDSNVNLPNITTPENSPFLNEIHITEEQVFDHLSTLDISKYSLSTNIGG